MVMDSNFASHDNTFLLAKKHNFHFFITFVRMYYFENGYHQKFNKN